MEKELQIRSEQLKILFAPTIPVTIAHVIASIMMIHLLWGQTAVNHETLIFFAALISAIAFARFLLFVVYEKKLLLPTQVNVWEKRFLTGSITIGLAWALTEVSLFPKLDEYHQVIMILIVGGISALGTITLSAMRSTYITFIPIVIMPITVMMFFENYLDASAIAILLTLMTIGFLGGAKRNCNNIVQNIALRIESNDREATIQISEEKLKKSEERFALALKGANDGLWDWNLKADEVYYSPRWISMLGYEAGELDAHPDTWANLLHPDDKDWALEKVQDCLEGRSDSLVLEIRMRHKQGEWINILSRGFLVRHASDNKPLRFVGTHTDITEHKVMMGELQLLTENRKLSQQLLQVQENERNSLARDLHDNLGQSLSAISSITALISAHTKSRDIADNAAEIKLIVDSIFETVRGMLSRMRPHMLDLMGLCPAIEDLFEYSCKGSGTTCSLTASEDFSDLPDAVSVAVYRAVQEACTNVVRHADASRLEVELHMVEQKKESGTIKKEVMLNIRDDGKGVNLSEPGSFGLGLIGMRERIMSLDGKCQFNTAPGEGMHIAIMIPLTCENMGT